MLRLQPVSPSKIPGRLLLLLVLAGLALPWWHLQAHEPQGQGKDGKTSDEVSLPLDAISAQAWKKASTAPLQPGEIDRLIGQALVKAGIKPSRLTTDEEFVRRVYLDLTGKLPAPAEVTTFLQDRRTDKRARLIDRLLDSDDYARHWAVYWRTVVAAQNTDPITQFFADPFEKWMTEQLQKNVPWDKVARAMITASGEIRRDQPDKNGAAFLFLSRRGGDATAERAADVSRLFLGIQIQCAQCHDHPFDDWKRVQFHEFAAYLARVRERPVFDTEKKQVAGFRLVSLPFAEHRMEDSKNPEKKTTIFPKFLDGTSPGAKLNDVQRRAALARSITAKENPWFAAAFVNRMWGELMGQSFYKPIDDLGPRHEAVLPNVVTRLAGSFRGSDYDVKQLLRAVLNSQTYQRRIRLGKATDEHLLFAASYPRRLQGEALWNSLECALGKMNFPGAFAKRPGAGPYARFFGPKFQFLKEFNYDPSTRPEEVEGTIPQALWMMNNPLLNQKIRGAGPNLLAQVLQAQPKNDAAVKTLYLRTLARRPSERELNRCLTYVQSVGNRREAFEDILWVLINSTEFQTKR